MARKPKGLRAIFVPAPFTDFLKLKAVSLQLYATNRDLTQRTQSANLSVSHSTLAQDRTVHVRAPYYADIFCLSDAILAKTRFACA